MAKLALEPGVSSVTFNIFLPNASSTSGLGRTGISLPQAVSAIYIRERASTVSIVLASLASADAVWTSGGWREIDQTNAPGMYRLDAPSELTLAGVRFADVMIRANGIVPTVLEIDLNAQVNVTQIFSVGVNSTIAHIGVNVVSMTVNALTSGAIQANAFTSGKFSNNIFDQSHFTTTFLTFVRSGLATSGVQSNIISFLQSIASNLSFAISTQLSTIQAHSTQWSGISSIASDIFSLANGTKGFSSIFSQVSTITVDTAGLATAAQLSFAISTQLSAIQAWSTQLSGISSIASDIFSLANGVKGFSNIYADTNVLSSRFSDISTTAGLISNITAKATQLSFAISTQLSTIQAHSAQWSGISSIVSDIFSLANGAKGFSSIFSQVSTITATVDTSGLATASQLSFAISTQLSTIQAFSAQLSGISSIASDIFSLANGSKGFSSIFSQVSTITATVDTSGLATASQLSFAISTQLSAIQARSAQLSGISSVVSDIFSLATGSKGFSSIFSQVSTITATVDTSGLATASQLSFAISSQLSNIQAHSAQWSGISSVASDIFSLANGTKGFSSIFSQVSTITATVDASGLATASQLSFAISSQLSAIQARSAQLSGISSVVSDIFSLANGTKGFSSIFSQVSTITATVDTSGLATASQLSFAISSQLSTIQAMSAQLSGISSIASDIFSLAAGSRGFSSIFSQVSTINVDTTGLATASQLSFAISNQLSTIQSFSAQLSAISSMLSDTYSLAVGNKGFSSIFSQVSTINVDTTGLAHASQLSFAISSQLSGIFNFTSNLDGRLTTSRAIVLDGLSGSVAQTGDTYLIAAGAAGFVAIKSDTAAILTDTGTTGVIVVSNNDKNGYILASNGLLSIAFSEPSSAFNWSGATITTALAWITELATTEQTRTSSLGILRNSAGSAVASVALSATSALVTRGRWQ